MLTTNKDRLVMLSVIGEITSPTYRFPYNVSHDGIPMVLPGSGGITYNVRVGDPAFGWYADHVEPGVSVSNKEGKDEPTAPENRGLNILACIGNRARVTSGDAKGATGYVTGTHGGVEHVLVDFQPSDLEKLTVGDKIVIKSYGQGLMIPGHPEIKFYNLDPDLLHEINPSIDKHGMLEVPVVATVPAEIMGSGIGSISTVSGDYDIATADTDKIKELGLESLRLGDLVALMDTDNSFGRCFRKGAVTIGVVVHSNSIIAGHGPGVTTIITSKEGKIKPIIDKNANIAYYLGIRQL